MFLFEEFRVPFSQVIESIVVGLAIFNCTSLKRRILRKRMKSFTSKNHELSYLFSSAY